jgi:aryl-alcohol dehydrogenase-like predicted oxidoreductase
MNSSVNRRSFLKQTSSGIVAGAALPYIAHAEPLVKDGVPTRTLGKTGAKVSMIGIGCGTKFSTSAWKRGEDYGIRLIRTAIDHGINYLDTAAIYTYLSPEGKCGPRGFSERLLGRALKGRRDKVFLASKTLYRNRDDALKDVELSLKNLQTDYLDLIQIHSLSRAGDIDRIEADDGCLKALRELQQQKVVRHIGITCHQDGILLKKALDRLDLDTVLMALNAALSKNPLAWGENHMAPITTFESHALPTALKRNMGVIAMKALGFNLLVGKGPGLGRPADLIKYNLSLPVSTAIIGTDSLEILNENVELAKKFAKLKEPELKRLRQQMAPSIAMLDKFFTKHLDC